ncbi:MAG: oligosaccharide flippase family protein, partial [Paludibacteraceae bacterium]|nr:oligosaccharide flippase family protein [Paludibacteraceae bacterium]
MFIVARDLGVIAKQGIRGTILTYAGTVVGAVTTLFVVAHFLTAEDYGLAQLLIDMAVMLSTLMQLGTGSALIRFWP